MVNTITSLSLYIYTCNYIKLLYIHIYIYILESDNAIDNLQTKIKERLQNKNGNDIEESVKDLEEKHQD